MTTRLRAVVLAAGHGNRLRPLTEGTPKPLLPLCGQAIVAWTLDELAAIGCEACALNLHHRGDQIPAALGTEWKGMPLVYSEEPEILGTLGALLPLRDFLRPADAILLINGDSLCRWPLKKLLRRHAGRRPRTLATLLLAARAEPERYGGGAAIDGDGRLVAIRDGGGPRDDEENLRRVVFAGAQVLEPEVLDRLPDGPSDIVTHLYQRQLAAGEKVWTFSTRRPWHDLGTPARYLSGALSRTRRPRRRRWVAEGAEIGPGVRLLRAVVETGARLGAGSRLEEVLILPGARLGEGCELRHTIVGPGVELPPRTRVDSRLITRHQNAPVPVGSSVVGELVYTPLAG